jgi:hypothetical protein
MDNKLPITRLSKFFGQDDFDLNIKMGEEYLHGDLGMKLVLYRVDRSKTDIDDVYAEVGMDEIKYFPPIEFFGLVKIEEPKNSTYKDGLVRYNEPGNMTISIYKKHIDEMGIEITYGDFIGYPESETRTRFYTVIDDGRVISDNKHNMFGFKPYYRTVRCTPAPDTTFRGV